MSGGGQIPGLNEDELTRFETAFYSVDAADGGNLTVNQIRQLADKVAPQAIADEHVKYVYQQCKGDVYDFPKMLVLLSEAITCPSTEEDLKMSFEAFDVDGDGHVSPDEIRKILHADPSTTVTEEDIADIVRACDRDGDGQLNWEEVVAAMKH